MNEGRLPAKSSESGPAAIGPAEAILQRAYQRRFEDIVGPLKTTAQGNTNQDSVQAVERVQTSIVNPAHPLPVAGAPTDATLL